MRLRNLLVVALMLVACSKVEQNNTTSGSNVPSGQNQGSTPPAGSTAPQDANPVPLRPDQILSPMDAIKDLDHRMDSYKTGDNLSPADIENNKKIKADIIKGTFDLRELCRLALDVHWDEINDQQKAHFVDLMTNLLERKAIFSKEQVKGDDKPYTVNYKQQKFLNPEKTKVLVITEINIPSDKIKMNINYNMLLTPYGWKIYDVKVDDASLVENYKFQFDTIIKKSGFADLVARMEKKLNEMN